jgi:YegS/Rv2252/BmrU family lipid kinase
MKPALVLINPYAASGTALALWQRIEPTFQQVFGKPQLAITHQPSEILPAIEQAARQGIETVFSIGGDGTNNVVVNALLQHNQAHPRQTLTFASIPAGTGRDWVRGLGLPIHDPHAALHWLADKTPRRVDVGCLQIGEQVRYFLNICSVGLSGDVVQRVERHKTRRLAFFRSTVEAILYYQPPKIRMEVDDQLFFEGKTFVGVIANGKYFGQGMLVAPAASLSDGLLDVMVVDDVPRWYALRVFALVYSGSHVTNPYVHIQQARHIRITSESVLGIEIDGDFLSGQELRYSLLPAALSILG